MRGIIVLIRVKTNHIVICYIKYTNCCQYYGVHEIRPRTWRRARNHELYIKVCVFKINRNSMYDKKGLYHWILEVNCVLFNEYDVIQ